MTSPVNTGLLTRVYHPAKRQRGGQPGNQNARINLVPAKAGNGFYASLSPAEICQFWNIVNTEGLEPEIAALRVKLRSSLERDPVTFACSAKPPSCLPGGTLRNTNSTKRIALL